MFRFGFLGGGQMAEAIIGGLKEKATEYHLEYVLYDPARERRLWLKDKYDVEILNSNKEVMERSSVVFVAVKPQIYPEIKDIIAENYREGQIIISMMAGVDLDALEEGLPGAKIIRIMPNTAMAVGAGVCLFAANQKVADKEKSWLVEVLSTLGLVQELNESIMDGAMAVSASSPAFFYTMIEGLILGGIEVGLPKKMAKELAVHTMLGCAKLLLETGEEAPVLRDNVLSPGGTTIEGIRKLEAGGFRSDIIEAVAATAAKGKALSLKE
ncbi:MAG: pyrroline-5-carboxylate reductase [Bacillota bacterium]|nr:pyrroline-5-carboxylate reductase [Bacillota bacterium]